MAKTGKFPVVGDVLVLLILFFVSQLIVASLLQVFGLALPATPAIDTVPIDEYIAAQEAYGRACALFYPLTMLIPLIIMWIYARLRGGRRVVKVRCSIVGFNPLIILVGVLWLLSSQVVLEPLVLMLPARQTPGVGLGVWAYITTIASAPILEELLCRGFLLGTFNRRWGFGVSIILSALFFGLIHFDLATAVVATMAGIIFGVLYVRTSSIFASMTVHAINNALAFMLIILGKENTPFREVVGDDRIYYIIYGVAAVIFVAASIEGILKLRAMKVKKGE